MTTLDARGRKAAAAINHSVTEFTPTVTVSDLVHRAAVQRALNFAGAIAVVVLAVVVGALLRTATQTEEVADTLPPEPSVTTTVAPIEEPVELPDIIVPTDPDADPVVPPGIPGGDDAAAPEDEPVEEPPAEEPVEDVDTEPPAIAVTSPKAGATLGEKIIRFEGTTEPGATVAAGKYEADVDGAGNWGITLVLSPGGNRARFTATDSAGNAATASITVYYEPPEEPKPPKEHEFSAYSTFGECALDPPYDVYYGTADPGEKITITSEYGGGTVNADAEGNWELKVFFPEAPYDKTFHVKVKDTKGNLKKFDFVALEPA